MRNFLYNNSDILVALGIVVAAGLLIFWKTRLPSIVL